MASISWCVSLYFLAEDKCATQEDFTESDRLGFRSYQPCTSESVVDEDFVQSKEDYVSQYQCQTIKVVGSTVLENSGRIFPDEYAAREKLIVFRCREQ